MGISGLLPLLKEIQVPRKIEDFCGKRLAVDAYVWLHKGAFGCAEDLVKGRKTTRFVDYAMHRVAMLRHWGITPYVVFDGGPLPAKRGTEDSRAKSRADSLARAQAFEAQGRWKDARDCYTKCIDITPEMAYQLIKALRAEKVEYVVAPYEADAQLCFLEREGFVDGVITEDSDLLVFGCKTVIFKLDKDGNCVSIDGTKMAMVRELPMHGWTELEFRRMAMLSGCDYLPSIPGIGLKKAHRMLRRYKTVEKSLQAIRLEGSHSIPRDYAAAFSKAELAFLYQRVFCPEKRRLVTLTELPSSGLTEEEEKWVGLDLEIEVAQGLALGDLHPETCEPIEDQWPDFKPALGMYCRAGAAAPRTGTLDGVFKPLKKTRSAPPAPVPRLGEMASGPTRLSDLKPGLNRRVSEPMQTTPPPKEVKMSKFFKRREPELEPEIDEPAYDLQWEESIATTIASPEHARLPSPEPLRSPSPCVSTIHPTPARLDTDGHFTSPVSEHSGFSSPPRSAPRPECDDRAEPSSPTPPARVLVAASSQAITCATVGTTTPSSDPSDPDTPMRQFRKITSVLVPASSPFSQPRPQRPPLLESSDSALDDNIVTPTPVLKRERVPSAKRRRADDPDPDLDSDAADRARKVAEGWKAKYALGGSSPGPVPPRRPASRPRTSMPISAGAGILASRSVNVPERRVVESTPKPKAKAEAEALPQPQPQSQRPVTPKMSENQTPRASEPKPPRATTGDQPTPKPAPNPCGLTWAALERFRFSR